MTGGTLTVILETVFFSIDTAIIYSYAFFLHQVEWCLGLVSQNWSARPWYFLQQRFPGFKNPPAPSALAPSSQGRKELAAHPESKKREPNCKINKSIACIDSGSTYCNNSSNNNNNDDDDDDENDDGTRVVYIHMCLCVYVSMYLCIYVSMYLSIYLSIYVSMYLCILVSMYSIYLSMYLCI